MQKVKLGLVVVLIGLCTTLILSLFLVFAQNTGLPLLRSTGMGLLGFGELVIQVNPNTGAIYVGPEGFFNNVYSYSDSGFEIVGAIVGAMYWFFCITCVSVLCFTLVSLFLKPKQVKMALVFVYIEVGLGFGMIAIALLCIIVPTFLYNFYYVYSTQYYFLVIPLIITLVAAIFTHRELRKLSRQHATPPAAVSYPSGANQYMPTAVQAGNAPMGAPVQGVPADKQH